MAAAHIAQAAIRRHRQQENHARHSVPSSLEASHEESAEAAVITISPAMEQDASTQSPSLPSPPDSSSAAYVGANRFVPGQSSTPVRTRPSGLHPSSNSRSTASDTDGSRGVPSQSSSEAAFDLPLFRAPILGYEIMEQRAKFTVFKINVQHLLSHESWFVFRRYTDFLRLNKKLQDTCPSMQLSLPPKRWFKDNFNAVFLEQRVLKLQHFIDGLLGSRQILDSQHVRDFFCLDDPPGPNDSLEESRLRCENLEELVSTLHVELREKEAEVEVLRAELALSKAHRETLAKSLRLECAIVERAAPRYLPADCANARRLHQVNVSLANMIENSINLSDHAALEGSVRLPAPTDNAPREATNHPLGYSPVRFKSPALNSETLRNAAVLQNGLDLTSSAREAPESSVNLDNHSDDRLHLRTVGSAPPPNDELSTNGPSSRIDVAATGVTDGNGNKTFAASGDAAQFISNSQL